MSTFHTSISAFLLIVTTTSLNADDWLRFRGQDGAGFGGERPTPTTWSDEENIVWKKELPGAGASSPIVVGNRVFVTCYSGYGVQEGEGSIDDLSRHLLCFDRRTGELLWERSTDATPNEDPYSGRGVPEHGYASSTPVSDGENVYVFFGKSGVLAYDFAGNQLWHTGVGSSSGNAQWGSGASPVLADDLLIVNASDEDSAIYGLDKSTGDVVWRHQDPAIANTWSTPLIASVGDKSQILVLVQNEIWALDPEDGERLWKTEGTGESLVNSSITPAGEYFVAMCGRDGQTVAIQPNVDRDASDASLIWKNRHRVRIATPVAYNGLLFWLRNGIVYCADVETGEQIFQDRIGQRGGGNYASPVAADGKVYIMTRSGLTYVLAATRSVELLATNAIESDNSDFSATPAISNGQLFIRSDTHLYCIGE